MEGYGQFCPVAHAAEVLARRWTLLVVRELLCGSVRFNDIHRGVPRMSRTLLSRRLTELEEAGLVERRADGDGRPEYHLTAAGEALMPVVMALGEWGKRWLRRQVRPDDLDAGLLMWDMRRRVPRERLPRRRVTLRFTFTDEPPERRHYWLVLSAAGVDLCVTDPGFGRDLEVESDVATLVRVWTGEVELARVLGSDGVRIRGRRELRDRLPEWLGLSVFA